MDMLRRAALTIALTMLAFSAGLAAGHALAIPTSSGSSDAPAMIGGAPETNRSAHERRCSSTLGTEDYETCKVQFGE